MKRSKIHVNQVSTMTRWGGVERMLVDFLVQSTESTMFQHSLISTSSHPDITSQLPPQINYFEPRRTFHYDPRAIVQMVQWYRRNMPQIVHTHNLVSNVWGGISAHLAGIPRIIGGERGTIYTQKGIMHFLNGIIYKLADHVVANSIATKKLITLRHSVAPTKISVVHNMVPDFVKISFREARKRLGVSENDFVVGSIGRLVPQKDYQTFINMCAKLSTTLPNAKFVLIGGGQQLEKLKERAKELNIQNKIKFFGWRSDARDLLQGFDLFVSTSVFEPFGNVLVEAALSKKVVVAPLVDGIADVIIPEETGVLLTPKQDLSTENLMELPRFVVVEGLPTAPKALNIEELAEAIIALANDKDKRDFLAFNGYQRAKEKFSFQRYTTQLESIYLNEKN